MKTVATLGSHWSVNSLHADNIHNTLHTFTFPQPCCADLLQNAVKYILHHYNTHTRMHSEVFSHLDLCSDLSWLESVWFSHLYIHFDITSPNTARSAQTCWAACLDVGTMTCNHIWSKQHKVSHERVNQSCTRWAWLLKVGTAAGVQGPALTGQIISSAFLIIQYYALW